MNRHARDKRRKGHQNSMTNAEANTAAPVVAQGAQNAPERASSNKRATAKKNAPKTPKPAKGAKPKKRANKKREPKPRRQRNAGPRAESKGAKVLEMVARANGASLADLMKATQWQAHSIRGFLSTASKKHNVKIESSKNDQGERVYRIAK